MMRHMALLGLKELAGRWRTTLGMVAAVAMALVVFLALESITNGVFATFSAPEGENWIVQQKGSLGEFTGSRLPVEYQERLSALGAEVVVGEIHGGAGTSLADVTLVRGVPLDSYPQVEAFTLSSGTALVPGDQGTAMAGEALARLRAWNVADTVRVGTQDFVIQGIFRTGSLADSEMWLSLSDAQDLLGFGDDVSVYVVRGPETLPARIEAELGVDVTREGEGLAGFSRSIESMFRVLRITSGVMAVAAALSILTVMSTVVRTRRRQLAVLRTVGFGRPALLVYVLSQTGIVAVAGYAVALGAVVGLLRGLDFEAAGFALSPLLDAKVAATAFIWSLAVGLAAGAYPALLAVRLNIAETLRAE